MRKMLLLNDCSAGRKGTVVTVPDSFAYRLNESGDGKPVAEEKKAEAARPAAKAKKGAADEP